MRVATGEKRDQLLRAASDEATQHDEYGTPTGLHSLGE